MHCVYICLGITSIDYFAVLRLLNALSIFGIVRPDHMVCNMIPLRTIAKRHFIYGVA